MVLFVLRKLILQMHMPRHPVGLDAWFLVGLFVYFHTSCVQTAKALVRLRGCAGSPEPSLFAYVISTIISWAGSNYLYYHLELQLIQWWSILCLVYQTSSAHQLSISKIKLSLINLKEVSVTTHICLVDSSILINWTCPFPVLGMPGALLHFDSISDSYSCMQTVKTLIRHRILWRLIWVCTVCLCPKKWDARLIWFKKENFFIQEKQS